METVQTSSALVRRSRAAWAPVLGILVGLFIPASLLPAGAETAAPVNTVPAITDGQRSVLRDMQAVFENVAQQMDPAVVHIETEIAAPHTNGNGGNDLNNPNGGNGGNGGGQVFPFPGFPGFPNMRQVPQGPAHASGSGIIVDPNGVIVTNRHVVRDATRVTVTLTDHRTFRGTVFQDPNIDIAVVKIDATGLPYAHLSDSNGVKIGQWAIAIGYPFDVGETVSVGIISALGRSQFIEDQFYPNLIQTDASINPGNSGGALCDIEGNVIGVNTAIAGEGQSAGIGFAIPSAAVQMVWPQLASPTHKITRYPPGWVRGKLGVGVVSVTPDLFTTLGVQQGALVQEVQPDTPAARAGIEAGDVITKVNDIPVRDRDELVNTVSDMGPDKLITLTIVRNKQTLTKQVTTGSFAETPATGGGPRGAEIGLTVQTLTNDMRGELNLPPNVTGAVVAGVQQGSAADQAGFQQGDLIVSVSGTPIHSADDYNAVIAKSKPGDTIGVRIYRKNEQLFLTLQIPDANTH